MKLSIKLAGIGEKFSLSDTVIKTDISHDGGTR